MPFLQVELALNKAISKSRMPVFNNVTIRPNVNSKREIIKTSHAQNFLFFVIMERIRKGSDLPKKKVGVTLHPKKIFSHQVNAAAFSTTFVKCFSRCTCLMYDVARTCLMNSVCSRNAQ